MHVGLGLTPPTNSSSRLSTSDSSVLWRVWEVQLHQHRVIEVRTLLVLLRLRDLRSSGAIPRHATEAGGFLLGKQVVLGSCGEARPMTAWPMQGGEI